MRVLLNTYPVAFDCPGGGEVQLLESRAALVRAGVDVQLFDPWRPQLARTDVVHYFSVQGGSLNFCAHVKRRGLPLLLSPILWLTEDALPRYPLGEIRELLHLADRILPNSLAERDQLASYFDVDPARFTVTHNGIGRAFLTPADPRLFRRHFGITGPFLLNVANIEPRKNQVRLARAIQGLGLPLVILGRVRDPAYFERCLAEGGGQVHYLGPVDHASDLLRSAYAACSAFVLPSLLETPGLAALEAAATGAKLVVTSVGCTREYFGDHAVYVDPLDEQDIRGGIIGALAQNASTPARSASETHGSPTPALNRSRFARFTWDATAQELIEAYGQVLVRSAAA